MLELTTLETQMTMYRVGLTEFRMNPGKLVRAVRDKGDKYLITRRGRPVAVLEPLAPEEGGGRRETEASATRRVGVREMKAHVNEIVGDLQSDGDNLLVTMQGEPAAVLREAPEGETEEERRARWEAALARIDELARQNEALRKVNMTAVELVREQRR